MTTGEKNIKICEALGWRKQGVGDYCWTLSDMKMLLPPEELPNHFDDLNACHEMERLLNEDQYTSYVERLQGFYQCDTIRIDIRWVSATAAQRAEAFGLTLNLWSLTC